MIRSANYHNLFAPVCLFVYSRVGHTQKTIEALLANEEANETDLIIFSDGAKGLDDASDVGHVRDYLGTIQGFQSITIHSSNANLGLARSIIDGVGKVLASFDKVIVLEDDMVTSPYFLKYMNEALCRFSDDERIISIHGYVYPVRDKLPNAFFLRGSDCWGWATWRRGWDLFNPDGRELFASLKSKGLLRKFDFDGAYPYSKMLKDQIKGKNDSWAIRWYASAFLLNKLTLYPGKSLINNIGNDSSGTHCGATEVYHPDLTMCPIDLSKLEVKHSARAFKSFNNFFRSSRSNSGFGPLVQSFIRWAYFCMQRGLH